MISTNQARRLADAWVSVICGADVAVVPELTITKPYGWVFFYNSLKWIESRDYIQHGLIGNAPILVDRVNAEIFRISTAIPVEEYLAEYEAAIPPARLKMEIAADPDSPW